VFGSIFMATTPLAGFMAWTSPAERGAASGNRANPVSGSPDGRSPARQHAELT
jgi:hypothetical protein